MAYQTGSSTLKDRAYAWFWWAEQTFVNILAITFGTVVGLAHGSVHATKSLYPNLTSVDGAKRLYYGDPSSSLSQHSRRYVQDYTTAAKEKADGVLGQSSTSAKTSKPSSLANGSYTSNPSSKTNEIKQELYEAPATAKAGLTAAGTKVNDTLSNATTNVKQAVSGDGYTRPPHSDVFSNRTVTTNDSYSTKNGTTAAAYSTKNGTADDKSSIVSPTDTDGDSETDDEAGSEYTVGSSAPTTPRGSVLAPSPDAANGKDKKKRRKRISKGIKKTFSKISDALTPSSSQG